MYNLWVLALKCLVSTLYLCIQSNKYMFSKVGQVVSKRDMSAYIYIYKAWHNRVIHGNIFDIEIIIYPHLC